jgi:hypothetical protein
MAYKRTLDNYLEKIKMYFETLILKRRGYILTYGVLIMLQALYKKKNTKGPTA